MTSGGWLGFVFLGGLASAAARAGCGAGCRATPSSLDGGGLTAWDGVESSAGLETGGGSGGGGVAAREGFASAAGRGDAVEAGLSGTVDCSTPRFQKRNTSAEQ